MSRYSQFEDRYNYLRLMGEIGASTFGFDRYINQRFYTSREWRLVRHQVIIRDNGCDLGAPGHDIYGTIFIHHMNPMTVEDVKYGNNDILDPEFLVTVTHRTHNAIHYGDERLLPQPFVERKPGDTKLW